MGKVTHILLVAMVVLGAGAGVYAEDWAVGEKWTYQHQGPRPFGDGSATVKGDRTMEITAITGQGDAKRYLLKTTWGTEDANPSTSHIDAQNRMHKIEIPAMGAMAFKPPVPALWSLKAGQEQTVKSTVDIAGFTLTIEYKAKRLADETLTVPAGSFKNCQHIQIVSTMQSDMMPTAKGKMDYWYHPKVKNIVKEIVVTNYEGDNSYTATSLLKAHTKKN